MSENIETLEGWERSGPCFTRVHDGKLAVLELDELLDGAYPVVHLERGCTTSVGYLPLPDAVAWANEQLGVPKPVEVVRVVCEDAILEYSSDHKRSARYEPIGIGSAEVIRRDQQYVRGDA